VRVQKAKELLSRDLVRGRIGYLLQLSAEKSVLEVAKRRVVLQKIVETHVGHVVPELKEKLGVEDEGALYAVGAVELEGESGEVKRVKMRDAVKAARELNMMDGVYPERTTRVKHEGELKIAGVHFVFDVSGRVSEEEKKRVEKMVEDAQVAAVEYERREDEEVKEFLRKMGMNENLLTDGGLKSENAAEGV